MDEKYKELYNLSLGVLEEEQQRINRLDEKASRYFSVLSFLIGIYSVFCTTIITKGIPLNGWLDISILIIGFLNFIGLVIAWFLCFAIFRQHVITKIPLNEEMIKFFNDNDLIDIHYALAKSNKDALVKNRKISDCKSSILAVTYKLLSAVMVVMVLMMGLLGVKEWATKNMIKKGGAQMTEENKRKDKPREDIKPPVYDNITEGYVPPKNKMLEKDVVKKDSEKK